MDFIKTYKLIYGSGAPMIHVVNNFH